MSPDVRPCLMARIDETKPISLEVMAGQRVVKQMRLCSTIFAVDKKSLPLFARRLKVPRADSSTRRSENSQMFDQYQVDGLFDEMFIEKGIPRAHYASVA